MNKELGGYSGGEEAQQQTLRRTENRPDAPRSSKVFFERGKAAGALVNKDDGTPILDVRREAILEAHMTTPATFKDLRPLAGGVSTGRVRELFYSAFDKFVRNLPQEMLDECRGLRRPFFKVYERPKKPAQ